MWYYVNNEQEMIQSTELTAFSHFQNPCQLYPFISWVLEISLCGLWSWCHHQMETFSALLALYEVNPLVTSGFPSQRLVMWRFDVFFDLCLNKWLSKQSRRGWFETPSRSLWHHSNVILNPSSPRWLKPSKIFSILLFHHFISICYVSHCRPSHIVSLLHYLEKIMQWKVM